MALRGTTRDLKIVDLLQYCQHGRVSGRLSISRGGERAEVFYVRGKIVHAELSSQAGWSVLEQISRWNFAMFEYRTDVTTDKTTIEIGSGSVLETLRSRMQPEDQDQVCILRGRFQGPSGHDSVDASLRRSTWQDANEHAEELDEEQQDHSTWTPPPSIFTDREREKGGAAVFKLEDTQVGVPTPKAQEM